jgi:hypothetical protein
MKPSAAAVTVMKEAVRQALPHGKGFQMLSDPTSIAGSYVLRIITPAWKSMPKMDRVLRIGEHLMPVIPAKDRKHIFYVSVMTPGEWKEFRLDDMRKRKFTVLAKSGHVTVATKAAKAHSAKQKTRAAKTS